jgi:hypothetical protein
VTRQLGEEVFDCAIVGHSEDVPDKLVDALVKTVETGAFSRVERNRVAEHEAPEEARAGSVVFRYVQPGLRPLL